MQRLYFQINALLPHIMAGGVALIYAWVIAQTSLRTSGFQFVAPLIVIVAVHLILLGLRGRLQVGFATQLFRQASVTAATLFLMLVLGSIFAPQPAYARAGGGGEAILAFVFCAAMIVAVIWLLAIFIRAANYGLSKLPPVDPSKTDDDPKNRLFDFGSVIACCAVLGVASLEGVPQAYAFATNNSAASDQFVDASPAKVWQAMQTATSPEFPLPNILGVFPRPVAVLVDEGVAMGANRVVQFAGREGAGQLHLRVVERSETMVRFAVLSDTSPYAGWIGHQYLRYDVVPIGAGSRVSVTLEFERRLAPAWFFGPMMRGAGRLAVDVLARDVKARAELVE